LRNKEDQDVINYLNEENGYTDAVMVESKELQEELYKEIISRIRETDISAPEKIDGYYYYNRTEEGRQYAIHCRKKLACDIDDPDFQKKFDEVKEEIVLDENKEAEGHQFFTLGALTVTQDQEVLGYSVDYTGNELYTLKFKNLITNESIPDHIENISAGLEWANGNRTYFYTVPDEAKRPYQVYKSKLGSNTRELVYEESDERFVVHISKSRDERYIFINTESKNTSEIRYIDTERLEEKPTLLLAREEGIEYGVDNHDDGFYIVTDKDALNCKVLFRSHASPADGWTEFVSHNPGVKIDALDCFKSFLVLSGRENGLTFIRIYDLVKREWVNLDMPDESYVVEVDANPEYETLRLRFIYSSMTTPTSVYDYNVERGEKKLRKQQEIPGGYDSAEYKVERVEATSDDGTKIPMSLVYKKGLFKKDGCSMLYLTGYGAYGIPYDVWFSSSRLALLNRGVIVAFAHIRGGGEFGKQWYYDGRVDKKKSTFNDFIACAERLVKDKYTSADRLAIQGGSAGGLLMGAVLNERPEIFRAAVVKVPFVDNLNTMMDPTLPLTVGEYEEWGDPNDKKVFEHIHSYAPYEHIEDKGYPNMLVLAGLNDSRVAYWEPAKWVAKLRAMKTDDNVLLLKTNMGAGHGGPSGRYDHLREVAFEYTFLLKALDQK